MKNNNIALKYNRINKLLDTYGVLLTPIQLKIMKDKYQYDLSLKEIADSYKISRSAVLDSINVSIKKLEDYDKKLKLIKKKNKILNLIKDKNTKKKINEII